MSDVATLTRLLEQVIGTKHEGKVRRARDRAISAEAEEEGREADMIVMGRGGKRMSPGISRHDLARLHQNQL